MVRDLATLGALLLGVAIGLAAGWLRFAAPPAPAVAAPEDTPRTEETRAAPVSEPVVAPERSKQSPPATLAEILATIPFEGPPPVEGKITGKVETEDGRPLAGVLVRARPVDAPSKDEDESDEEPDLEEVVRRAVVRHRWSTAGLREARTDASGSYALDRLRGSGFHVEATHDGYETRSVQHRWDVAPGDRVDFVASSRIEVPVQVLLPTREPAPTAVIYCAARGRSHDSLGWSIRKPFIRLPPGEYAIYAVHEDLRSDEQRISVDAGLDVPVLSLVLVARTGVRVRASAPDQEAGETLTVWAARLSPGAAPDAERLRRASQQSTSRRQPVVKFLDVLPGAYAIGAGRGSPEVIEVVQVVDGRIADHDLRVPALDPSDVVILRAFGPTGEVVRDFYCSWEYVAGEERHSPDRVGEREDGSQWAGIENPRALAKPEGHWRVEVTARGLGIAVAEVSGRAGEAVVRYGEPALLDVLVESGKVDPGSLRASLSSARSRGTAQAFSRGGRTLSFEPQAPGDYTLGIQTGAEVVVACMSVHLVPGPNAITVTLPALYPLRVRATGEPRHVRVYSLDSEPVWSTYADLDRTDVAMFEALPAGPYRIHRGRETMIVVVPGASSEVVFVADPVNALVAAIWDETGALARAGFRSGDCVIAIDGEDLTDEKTIDRVVQGALAKPLVKMTVRREGALLDLSVNLGEIYMKPSGGQLQPTSR
jgi:hypothetical protein